ncbi:uncharacterized protein LOC141665042 [Apium graveolens]|uniref:uncharacterized protein LOC141665042 n=1 Tax=Apium graveolens TaxID=4045 RepID=UPI003D7B564D
MVALHLPCPEGNFNPSPEEELPHSWWILYVNGVVNNEGTDAGIILVSPEGHHLMSAIHFHLHATNNDVEYEALINGLKIALDLGIMNLIAKSDSELVAKQVNQGFQARGSRTKLYLRCAYCLLGKFKKVRLQCVPQVKNSNADSLAKMGSQ